MKNGKHSHSITSIDPGELISPAATAFQLNVRPQTLALWRSRGHGPPYVKVGNRISYRPQDIASWLAKQLVVPSKRAARASPSRAHVTA